MICEYCKKEHTKRLDSIDALCEISDDRRHPLELRLMAEIALNLKLINDRIKEGDYTNPLVRT